MVKIAFAHINTLRIPRGIERFIINVANGLVKKGHDVTLIAGRCEQPLTREWIDDRIHVEEISHYNWHRLTFVPGYIRELLRNDYDVLNIAIARGEGYAAGLTHMIKKFRYNIVFQYPLEDHEKHFRAFNKFSTAKHADRLIAASSYIAQGVERYFGRTADTIPNGVDPQEFRADQGRRLEIRKKLGISDKAPVLITVAALQGRKGINKVLDVVSLLKRTLPDIRYIVCGDGNEKDRESFFSKVKSLGLVSNVLFMGNQKDVAGFYNAADLFIFLPEFEGFGIVALEAMASQLPILVSHGSAFPEILSEGGGIMVDPDATAIAAEMASLILRDREQHEQLGKAGRASVLKKYSWDAVAAQFERLFEQQVRL